MDVVNWTLIAQVSVAVTAAMQVLKTKQPFARLDGEYLAMTLGVVIALYFCAVTNHAGWAWGEWLQCGISGLVAGVTASSAFNVQKALPIPNLLPTRSEKEAASLK